MRGGIVGRHKVNRHSFLNRFVRMWLGPGVGRYQEGLGVLEKDSEPALKDLC